MTNFIIIFIVSKIQARELKLQIKLSPNVINNGDLSLRPKLTYQNNTYLRCMAFKDSTDEKFTNKLVETNFH